MRKKITVIGGGYVGEHVAIGCAQKELGDVVLLDILEGIPQGKGLDLFESSPVHGFDSRIKGTNAREDVRGSDVVVITAGLARKPGMGLSDLLRRNAEIVQSCAEQVRSGSPDALVIVVSNPVDVMAWVAKTVAALPRERVVGMLGILDAARFRSFIAMELCVSVESVQALVLGSHGDAMVPLPRLATVGGVPLVELLPADRIEELVARTVRGDAEIVGLLKTGSAYHAPAAGVVEMVESVVKDKKKVLPCTAWLEGEYGIDGVFLGVPVVLGSEGVERVLELKLEPDELRALRAAAGDVKKAQEQLQL
ncbi:MAG: malate dehydrogenase [Acidobacteriia bacterium]|nr:malate dehydrogenase [Terriglobia bacterium]